MSRRIIYLITLIIASSTLATASENPWIEVRSPHFRVLTNGSEKDGRGVARDFEYMRFVFATHFPNYRLESGAPLLIFAARDEKTAKALDPLLWKSSGAAPPGMYYSGREEQHALIRLDTWQRCSALFSRPSVEPCQTGQNIVFYLYTASILHMNLHWLPLWMEEGLSEFYSYTRLEDNRIVLGDPSVFYLILPHSALVPIETLIDLDSDAAYFRDEQKAGLFFAESWALVHFMTFGPGMEGGNKIRQFFDLMQKGVDQKKAFQQVFGDFKNMDFALSVYVSRPALPEEAGRTPPHLDENSFTSRTLSLAEMEAELGSYHLWSRYPIGAKPLVEQALKDNPKLGLAHEIEGFLLFEDGKLDAAADEFSQAFVLDPTLYLSLFAKNMISPLATSDVPADQAAYRLALVKVLNINPQFAPAYVQLARLSVRQGNLAEALRLSTAAENLEPWRPGYHIQTGQILLRMGRGADAAGFAQFVAPRSFGADHNEAVELWNEVPADQRPAGVSLTQTAPKDTQKLEGTIESVACTDEQEQERDKDKAWVFVLDHAGQTFTFHSKGGSYVGYSDTLWYGAHHFSWCHNLEGLRAVVYFRAPSDSSYTGDVAEIEIRNDLPAPPPAASQQSSPSTGPATGH